MKQSFHFLGALAIVSASAVLLQACGSDDTGPSTTASSTAASTGAGGAGGGGGTGGAGANPVDTDCKTLCDYLGSVNCMAWKNCSTECPAMFDAPPDCADEFETMLSCWVGHKTEFMCTDQLLTPDGCKDLEDTFYACFKGTGMGGIDCTSSAQVCGGDATMHCTCTTTCDTTAYKSACTPQGADWGCSCYANDRLLGTCSTPVDTTGMGCKAQASNFEGCCPPFFAAN